MKIHTFSPTWYGLLAVAGAVMALVLYQSDRWAIAEEGPTQGKIVEISPNKGDRPERESAPTVDLPPYWIGIQGATITSPVLQTHLQLAGDLGVVVANVLPDSPAEKAGLRKHDILIGVNGDPIHGMDVLQEAVATSDGEPIELKLIRLAEETTLTVTPEETPEDLPVAQTAPGFPGQFQDMGDLDDLFRQLGQGAFPNMQVFGPDMAFHGAFNGQGLNALPGGVSVTVTREGDGPAKITVKRGDKTWVVEGNDQEALDKLPDDIRPMVERMLSGGVTEFQFNGHQLEEFLPDDLGNFQDLQDDFEAQRQQMLERMQDLERRMERFQRQLREESPKPAVPDDQTT